MLASEAMKRETGVRSLRSMFEEVLLELRYDIGERKGQEIVIDGDYVRAALQRGPTGGAVELEPKVTQRPKPKPKPKPQPKRDSA